MFGGTVAEEGKKWKHFCKVNWDGQIDRMDMPYNHITNGPLDNDSSNRGTI